MSKQEEIQNVLESIKEVEEEIKVLQTNIQNAKEYLENTKTEDVDFEYFDEQLDVEKGLKHIVLF